MSLLFGRSARALTLADVGVRPRSSKTAVKVDRDSSLRSSVKWACLRLRSDLISTTPLDVFKQRDGDLLVPVDTPAVLRSPDGERDLSEWLYASQFDLDECGHDRHHADHRQHCSKICFLHSCNLTKKVL